MTDAEKLAHIREVIADEERLEDFHRGTPDGTNLAQASAFTKIRRFLYDQEGYPATYPNHGLGLENTTCN